MTILYSANELDGMFPASNSLNTSYTNSYNRDSCRLFGTDPLNIEISAKTDLWVHMHGRYVMGSNNDINVLGFYSGTALICGLAGYYLAYYDDTETLVKSDNSINSFSGGHDIDVHVDISNKLIEFYLL